MPAGGLAEHQGGVLLQLQPEDAELSQTANSSVNATVDSHSTRCRGPGESVTSKAPLPLAECGRIRVRVGWVPHSRRRVTHSARVAANGNPIRAAAGTFATCAAQNFNSGCLATRPMARTVR